MITKIPEIIHEESISTVLITEDNQIDKEHRRAYHITTPTKNSKKELKSLEDHLSLVEEFNDSESNFFNALTKNINDRYHENSSSYTESMSSKIEELNCSYININCQKHIEEEVNSYCFSTNECLCMKCVVDGSYKDKEVENIKKSAVYISIKFDEILSNIKEKLNILNNYEIKIQYKKRELQSEVDLLKQNIIKNFEDLRKNLDIKEKELLITADQFLHQKNWDIEILKNKTEVKKNDLLSLNNIVALKKNGLTDIQKCCYFSLRYHNIDDIMEKTGQLEFDSCNDDLYQYDVDTRTLNQLVHNLKIEVSNKPNIDRFQTNIDNKNEAYSVPQIHQEKIKNLNVDAAGIFPDTFVNDNGYYLSDKPEAPENFEGSLPISRVSLSTSNKSDGNADFEDIERIRDLITTATTLPIGNSTIVSKKPYEPTFCTEIIPRNNQNSSLKSFLFPSSHNLSRLANNYEEQIKKVRNSMKLTLASSFNDLPNIILNNQISPNTPSMAKRTSINSAMSQNSLFNFNSNSKKDLSTLRSLNNYLDFQRYKFRENSVTK